MNKQSQKIGKKMRRIGAFLFSLVLLSIGLLNIYYSLHVSYNIKISEIPPTYCHEDPKLRTYPCTLEDPNITDKLSNVGSKDENNKEWLEIWLRKGKSEGALTTEPLHHVTGFTEIDTDQYRTVVHTILTANPNVGLTNFPRGASIMEFGCGSGAFVNTLFELAPQKEFKVNGIDYSESMIDVAKRRVPYGNFWKMDARNVKPIFQQNEIFDATLSFSVFHYFNAMDDVYQILSEMVRVTKVGGSIIICDISDRGKQELATQIKSNSTHYQSTKYNVAKRTPPHLYVLKSFFYDNENKLGYKVDSILDESDMKPDISYYSATQWRYTVYATKVVSSSAEQ